jgi:hypothetical protein
MLHLPKLPSTDKIIGTQKSNLSSNVAHHRVIRGTKELPVLQIGDLGSKLKGSTNGMKITVPIMFHDCTTRRRSANQIYSFETEFFQ